MAGTGGAEMKKAKLPIGSKRVNVKAILADPDLRRNLMVSTIQATQAREGIDTTYEQADRAYQAALAARRELEGK